MTFQSSGGIIKNVSLQGTKMFQITFRRWWRSKDVLSSIILGYRQAVRHWTLTPAFRRFESYYPSQIRTQSQNDLWVLFFVMCFFEVKINLIFSQLWQGAADKIARRLWRAIFFCPYWEMKMFLYLFDYRGSERTYVPVSFLFLLPIRETQIDFIFSWSWQVTVKKRAFIVSILLLLGSKYGFTFFTIGGHF